jgi:hypothetical protein
MNILNKESELIAEQLLVKKSGFFSELAGQFSSIFERELPAPNLIQVVSGLALKIDLSKKQRTGLIQQAGVLEKMLEKSAHKELDEPMLVSVLQGGLVAGEKLVNDFDAQGNHQRPVLINVLNGLTAWFKTLSTHQQEKIKSMQQRSFRLSMG